MDEMLREKCTKTWPIQLWGHKDTGYFFICNSLVQYQNCSAKRFHETAVPVGLFNNTNSISHFSTEKGGAKPVKKSPCIKIGMFRASFNLNIIFAE